MRNKIILYLNGKREEISPEQSFMTTAEFLRYKKGLTGTKIVCSEGDCGACTILVSRLVDGEMTPYKSLNSCISFLYLLDRCHLITVEGVGQISHMHPVQESMLRCHGAQCGYCTPGIVCALAQMGNDLKNKNKTPTQQKVKNYLSGNLCRCTGYEPIIKAGLSLDMDKVETFENIYNDKEIEADLLSLEREVSISFGEKSLFLPGSIDEAVSFKASHTETILTSGATDLGVVHNKGKLDIKSTLSLNNIDQAYNITNSDEKIEIGAKVSLTAVEKACEKDFSEFSHMLHIFASPQIKNSGTLVGNIVNASPISDTVPFLRVADAELTITSHRGKRVVGINDFIKDGYKQLDLNSDEIVENIILSKTDHKYKLYKVSVRKDLDISTVTFACRYKLRGEIVEDISIAFGGVGPCVMRTLKLEDEIRGQKLSQSNFKKFAASVKNEITPLSDHRGSDQFRHDLCENLLLRFADEVIQENDFSFSEASL